MLQMKDGKYNRDKVRWACRRGMLELDKILIPFFDEMYDTLSSDKQELFVKLLESEDQDLHRWLLGTELPESPEQQDLVMVISFLAKKRVKQEVILD